MMRHDNYRTRRLVEVAYGEAVAVGARHGWRGIGERVLFQIVSSVSGRLTVVDLLGC